jgi:hypothetical protein
MIQIKKYTMRLIIPIVALLIVSGCASKVTTSGPSGPKEGGKYSEDLSVLRAQSTPSLDTAKNVTAAKNTDVKRDPSKYVEARHTVNQSLDVILDSINRYNLSHGVVDGFTIQLYSGGKREEALNVKKQISAALPHLETDVQFVQPNFRVRTGKYMNKLEAHKDYMAVKKYFPSAIIIPERIPIN